MRIGKNIGSQKQPIFIAVDEFKGHKYIDIRKYFLDKDGEHVATRKGVKLNVSQFSRMLEQIKAESSLIEEELKLGETGNVEVLRELKVSISDNIRGRIFQVEHLNGTRDVAISSQFLNEIEGDTKQIVGAMVSSLYESLFDILEDDILLNDVLDRWSHLLQLESI